MSNETRHELLPFFGNDGRAALFIKLFLENTDLIDSINENKPDTIRNYPYALDIILAENYRNKRSEMRNNDVHNDFTDFLIDIALFHKMIERAPQNITHYEPVANLWNNVYMNWHSLSSFSKKFYNKFLSFVIYQGVNKVKISDPKIYPYDINNKDKFRIFINKDNDGKPIFLNMIPKYASFFNDIWATDNDRKVIKLKDNGDQKIRKYFRKFGKEPSEPAEDSGPKEEEKKGPSGPSGPKEEEKKGPSGPAGDSGPKEEEETPPPPPPPPHPSQPPTTPLPSSPPPPPPPLESTREEKKEGTPPPPVPTREEKKEPTVEKPPLMPIQDIFRDLKGKVKIPYVREEEKEEEEEEEEEEEKKKETYYEEYTDKDWEEGDLNTIVKKRPETKIIPERKSEESKKKKRTTTTIGPDNEPKPGSTRPEEKTPIDITNILKTEFEQKEKERKRQEEEEERQKEEEEERQKEEDEDFIGGKYGGGKYGQNILKGIYLLFYYTLGSDLMPNPVKIWNPNVRNKIFHINIDKLILDRLYRRKTDIIIPEKKITYEPCISMIDKHVWNIDESGKWYTYDAQKNKIYFDVNDPNSVKILKNNFKCYSTGLNFENENNCELYMAECLLSKDPNDVTHCINFWKHRDIFQVTKDEILKMHPTVARATLAKFGFREHLVYDPIAKRNIKKIESVEHWIKDQLNKKFKNKVIDGKSVAETIQENDILLNYLRMLTEYVNSNPKILNENIYGIKTAESVGYIGSPKLAEKLGISMRQEPVNVKDSVTHDFGRLNGHVKSSYIGQLGRRTPLFSTLPFSFDNISRNIFGSPYTFSPYSNLFAIQYGGQKNVQLGQFNLPMFETQVDTNRITGADALKSIIFNTINEIEITHKKVMDKSDLEKITKKLNNLKCIENDLINAEMTLVEYRNLLEVFNNYKPDVVTEEKIRKYIEKYKGLYNIQFDYEKFLLKIFETLQKLLSDEKCTDFEYREIIF